MSEPSASSPPALRDAWDPRRLIPLNGRLERHRFSPLLLAFLVPVVAFLLFQLVFTPLAMGALLVAKGVEMADPVAMVQRVVEAHTDVLLVANSIGQVLGLAGPALLLATWHSSRFGAFLRLRRVDLRLVGLALAGWVALYPAVSWLGALNEQLPLPEFLQQMEQRQLELIEQVLVSDLGWTFNLLVLAIVPALCEEVLFRGYVQRQAERGWGAAGGVAFSGLIFGVFHLRLTQVLPLATLGLYLAYLVWRTGSLWPAVGVHFANNAFAVFAGARAGSDSQLSMENVEKMNLPWYVALLALAGFACVVYAMQQWAPVLRDHQRRAAPADASPER